MAIPMVGEIRMFAGNFAPAGWMFCDGAQLPISENDVLFTLIGTTYGGDGESTFNLPNLQSRIPLHVGTNPATGSSYILGESGGVEQVTLSVNQIPAHSHPLLGTNNNATLANPQDSVFARSTADVYTNQLTAVTMNPGMVTPVGGSQPHTNEQPFLCINFIISLFGTFPRFS
jgi:microcystin-dependent protein